MTRMKLQLVRFGLLLVALACISGAQLLAIDSAHASTGGAAVPAADESISAIQSTQGDAGIGCIVGDDLSHVSLIGSGD